MKKIFFIVLALISAVSLGFSVGNNDPNLQAKKYAPVNSNDLGAYVELPSGWTTDLQGDRLYITDGRGELEFGLTANDGASFQITQDFADHWVSLDMIFKIDGVVSESLQYTKDDADYYNMLFKTGTFTIESWFYEENDLTMGNIASSNGAGDEFYIETSGDVSISCVWYWTMDAVPLIDGNSTYITSIDALSTPEQIKAKYTAWDEVDGDITSSIYIDSAASTYKPDQITKTGNYLLVLKVQDSGGNIAQLNVTVFVADVKAPQIESSLLFVYPSLQSNPITPSQNNESLIALFTITDNYNAFDELTITFTDTDNWTENYNVAGTYNLKIKVEDTSGNSSEKAFEIVVIDDVAPTFATSVDRLQTTYKTPLTKAFILSHFTSNDPTATFGIEENTSGYFANQTKVGTYQEVVYVIDTAGNKTTHNLEIDVTDNGNPIFKISSTIYIAPTAEGITLDQIIQFLIDSGQLPNVEPTILLDEYSGNEHLAGTYAVAFGVADTILNLNLSLLTNEEAAEAIEDLDNVEEDIKNWFEQDGWYGLKNYVWVLIIGLPSAAAIALIIAGIVITINNKNKFKKGKKSKKR